MDENKIFLKTVEEKYERFLDYYTMMSSDFLSLEQQSALAGFLRAHSKENVYLFGGYPEAERRQVLFLPDYTGLAPQAQDADLLEYFRENPDECPIALLDVRVASAAREKLTHRDYLGALMGEGIRREKVGDIIVTERGAQILAMKEMCVYLAQNFRHVGRFEADVKILSIFELSYRESQTNCLHFTVSSPRIDNIVAAAYGLSRRLATEAILAGRVFVNGVETTKPDMSLKGGEKIVLRGKGKAIYHGINGTSKKGKLYISVDKYM